jgi:FKBP-type peptidyl-prolyl cis-trans isomerase SlyD
MPLQKKDFVELEFTAKIKETDQIFDTNIKEKAEEIGIENVKPLTVCIGEGMVLKGLDNALEGKELNKEYEIELSPQNAFGLRNPSLVKIVPINVFLEKNINPYPGLVLDMDGIIARISSVSGGRVLVDFNNPLSGKTVIYSFKITKKIDDSKEKIRILGEYYLGIDKFDLEGDSAIFAGNFQKKTFDEFSKKMKEILGIEVRLKQKEEKKEEAKK